MAAMPSNDIEVRIPPGEDARDFVAKIFLLNNNPIKNNQSVLLPPSYLV